jgi:hypothetical protein
LPVSFKNQTINNNKENTMKKVLLALLSIAIAFTAMQPSQAQDERVLAIIDTAIDSSKFPSIIHEVCFTENKSCPNKLNSMEGPGSASVVVWPSVITNGTYHGHAMVQGALAINPNVKIVFVRFANVTTLGNSTNTPGALTEAIKWVSQNAEKYSIDAVSISQSSISKNNLAACTTNTAVISSVSYLNSKNIAVFAATGNDKSTTIVGFPSCVEGVIGVGALAAFPSTPSVYANFAGVTNRGPGLDLVAPGDVSIVRYNGTSSATSATSGATVIAASAYVARNKYSSFAEYSKTLPKVLNFPYISK